MGKGLDGLHPLPDDQALTPENLLRPLALLGRGAGSWVGRALQMALSHPGVVLGPCRESCALSLRPTSSVIWAVGLPGLHLPQLCPPTPQLWWLRGGFFLLGPTSPLCSMAPEGQVTSDRIQDGAQGGFTPTQPPVRHVCGARERPSLLLQPTPAISPLQLLT